MKKPNSVAAILDRELEPTIKEWLRRVSLLPALTGIPLSDEDRALHLHKIFRDLSCRLRLAEGAHLPISAASTEHGPKRLHQGYLPALLIEESRLFEVITFQALHLHRDELDQNQLLLDVAVIADEADLQLAEAVDCWKTQVARPAEC